MSPARRDPAPGERSTPDALMDAALDLLARKGVRRRARAVFERMFGSLLATAGEPGAG